MNNPVTEMTAQQYRAYHAKGKPRRKPVQKESQMQQACVKWFRYQYPQYAKSLIAIPNAGKRGAINGARMKKEGMQKGTPDFFLAVMRGTFGGLWIENKAMNNRPTNDQVIMMFELSLRGYRVEVCRSKEQFIQIIEDYLK